MKRKKKKINVVSSRKIAVCVIFIILSISLSRRKHAVFSLDSGNFLHSSWYETVFGFVTKTILITKDVFITAEKHLHSDKSFSASHPTPPPSGLGVHKE